MLAQNSSQTFMPVLLACVLSLCSSHAFSDGTKQIQFFQEVGIDMDTYSVKAIRFPALEAQCVYDVWPSHVEMVPGGNTGQTMHVHYRSWGYLRASFWAAQLFKVQSKEHPDRVAYLWWNKNLGKGDTTPFA